MRPILASLLLTTALPAFADTYTLETDIARALITGSGGVVTYTADVALTPGRHTLIAYVPGNQYDAFVLDTRFGDPSSVRIISQAVAHEFSKPIERAPSAEEVAAENALNAAKTIQRTFEQTVEAKQAELTAAETQLELMKVTANAGFGSSDAGLSAEQVLAVANALGDITKQAAIAHAKAKTELMQMSVKRRDLQDDVDFAQKTLDALRPQGHVELVQVTTEIEVSTAQNTTIEIDNGETAYWSPTYTAELTQDGTKGTLLLHRKANVSIGRAGLKPLDEWDGVDITLSTANLSERTDTYIPYPQLRTLVDATRLRKSKSVSGYSASESILRADAPEPVVELNEESAGVSVAFAGQTLLFNLGDSNVDWTTQTSSFNIDTLTFDLDLYAMANAAQDQNAFLYTDLKNETGGVLLAGPVSLHRDGTPIGQTHLPQLVPNQDKAIGLGPLYGIQIKRDTLSVEEGDSGFISTKSEINRSYRTTLTSSLSYDMPFKLLDVIPTSENEDLVIRMSASPRPTEENRDGKRGVLVWEFDMDAGGTEQVNFAYEMKWPSGQIPVPK